MRRDYYAFRWAELSGSLNALEQATEALREAQRRRDKNVCNRAENQRKQAAGEAVKIEPHLAFLWYEANDSELSNVIRDAWQERLSIVSNPWGQGQHFDFSKEPKAFGFIPDTSAVGELPLLSFMLRIPFKLRKPYLSKDERNFYLLDNPLRREKVFRTPMVAATSWKGALRAALWQLGYREDNEITIRLLGNPRGSDEHQSGHLYFYPTFFDHIGLEVINSHHRDTGVGAPRGPILMECVAQGARGSLLLLYVPFGFIDQSDEQRREEVARDLKVLAQGVRAMLITYGFGAKTSSGFGMAEEQLAGEGKLVIRAQLDNLPLAASPVAKAPPLNLQPQLTEVTFRTLTELVEQARRVAERLRGGEKV